MLHRALNLVRFCEHSNETSGSIRGEKINSLSDY
jgi:hypothetical protein